MESDGSGRDTAWVTGGQLTGGLPGTRGFTEGETMDIFEIEQKETMSREEAAARLRAFADTLARNNDIEFERGGMHMKVHVPDEIQVKVELEIESDENELEIELTW
jgi:amphi-Trp domain-containing protein